MKGITPVISVVLLLMITVALVGFAFVWFQSIWKSVSSSTEQTVLAAVDKMDMTIKIDNVNGDDVTIRATGTKNINSTTLAFYVENVPKVCTWVTDQPTYTVLIPARGTLTCILNTNVTIGQTLKVAGLGNEDAKTATS